MTDEMQAVDAKRFLVIAEGNEIFSLFDNEADARKTASDFSMQDPDTEYRVYQLIASVTTALTAKWAGASR